MPAGEVWEKKNKNKVGGGGTKGRKNIGSSKTGFAVGRAQEMRMRSIEDPTI